MFNYYIYFKKWDPTLAQLAEYSVRDCKQKFDKCRNTHSYPNVGQIIGMAKRHYPYANNTETFQKSIKQWFKQFTNCPRTIIQKYRKIHQLCAAFTQMVQDDADQVGCAGVRYSKGKHLFSAYIVCFYSQGNVVGKRVYETGAACSLCSGKCGVNYPGLCWRLNETIHIVETTTDAEVTVNQTETTLGPSTITPTVTTNPDNANSTTSQPLIIPPVQLIQVNIDKNSTNSTIISGYFMINYEL